jgi:hypothetical protein
MTNDFISAPLTLTSSQIIFIFFIYILWYYTYTTVYIYKCKNYNDHFKFLIYNIFLSFLVNDEEKEVLQGIYKKKGFSCHT